MIKLSIALIVLILSSHTFSSWASTPTFKSSEESEWKKIGDEDSILIFSKKPVDGVLPFKAVGNIDKNINIILSTLKNHKTKHQWAPKLEKVKLHQQLSDSDYIFSEYYKTPWPASDREFLLKGEIKKVSSNSYLLLAHSIDKDPNYSRLKSEDHVQADVKYINLKLTQLAQNKTEIEFEFHGDMNGFMPVWLMNLIQKKWPLRFIQGLRKQVSASNQAQVASHP